MNCGVTGRPWRLRDAKRPRNHQRKLCSPHRASRRPFLHCATPPPTAPRCRGKTARACRPRGTHAAFDPASRQVAGIRHRATPRRLRRSVRDVAARSRVRVRRLPNTTHRGALRGQGDAEARPYPRADVFDEELLVRRKPCGIETRRILVQPPRLIGRAVHTDDHRRRHVRGFEDSAPLRDQLTSPANTIASLGCGGMYTVTCRPWS